MLKQSFLKIEIILFKDIVFQMVNSEIRFFTSRMVSSGESRATCFFVNYKRGLTLPKTELDSMSKRKLTTKFDEEPFFPEVLCYLPLGIFFAPVRPIPCPLFPFSRLPE